MNDGSGSVDWGGLLRRIGCSGEEFEGDRGRVTV